MDKSALIRVWNEKCDLTYITSMYDRSKHDDTMLFAKIKCKRWMRDNFKLSESEVENVNVEFLFEFWFDGIIHNDYFKNNEVKSEE